MKHTFSLICFFIASSIAFAQGTTAKASRKLMLSNNSKKQVMNNSIYNYKVTDINGKIFDFSTLKGKKVLIVNTASNCGFTPQYKELETLYQTYKNNGFVIVGFPANNFGAQEPGSNEEIASFCQKNYGVSFPMMGKVSVKGDDMTAVYQFLTQKSKNGVMDSTVKWNFQKYLINEKGELEKVMGSQTTPLSPEIVNWIKE
jgi:glutathione peroxidase